MSAFDDAVARHMAHPAGCMADGLTESLADQMTPAASAWQTDPRPAARVVPIGGWGNKSPRSERLATQAMADTVAPEEARAQSSAQAHAAGYKRGYILGVREGRIAGFCWGMAVGCALMGCALMAGALKLGAQS